LTRSPASYSSLKWYAPFNTFFLTLNTWALALAPAAAAAAASAKPVPAKGKAADVKGDFEPDTGRLFVSSNENVYELDLSSGPVDYWWMASHEDHLRGLAVADDGVRVFVVHLSGIAEIDTRTGVVGELAAFPVPQVARSSVIGVGGAAIDRAAGPLLFANHQRNCIQRLVGICP
jgi:hypothetical protein